MDSKRLFLMWASCGLLSFAFSQEITVQPGDSLWTIAQRHHTTVEALKLANGLSSDRLNPGHLLKLPDSADTTPESYTVQAGDHLYGISLAFGLSVDELVAINGLDGDVIRVGQVLRLTPSANAVPAAPLVVTVERGDSLWALARIHDVSLEAIAAANGIAADRPLRIGARLTIPGRYAGSDPAQGGYVAPSYLVQRGDSLETIARRHNTTVSALMSVNNLRNTRILAGQTLRVPSDRLSAAIAAPTPARDQHATALLRPVDGRITSRFGYRSLRIAGSNFHTGIDIGGNTGDPIRAAAPGVVSFSGWQTGYGNIVIITNGEREYRYAHASALLVERGATVEAGTVIARVGSTGYSTGPHLHFEVRIGGEAVDPLPLLQGAP